MLQLELQVTPELLSVWQKINSLRSVRFLHHSFLTTSGLLSNRWLLMSSHYDLDLTLGLFPVIFILGAAFITESSSYHMTIHLNLFILVASTIGVILLSLQRSSFHCLPHLVSPCIICMTFMSAAAIRPSSLFVNFQHSLPKKRIAKCFCVCDLTICRNKKI